MPLMCTAFMPGKMDEAVASIVDNDLRAVATAEAYYFRGQAAQAAEFARPYLDSPDPALRFSACFISGYANLSLNRIADARTCLAGLLSEESLDETPAVHAAHVLFAAAASVLLHLPSPYALDEFYPLVAHLPEGLRLFSSYVMAHAYYLHGQYGRCLGAAENALVMKQGSYPISELFLHLVAHPQPRLGRGRGRRPHHHGVHRLDAGMSRLVQRRDSPAYGCLDRHGEEPPVERLHQAGHNQPRRAYRAHAAVARAHVR